MCLTTSAFIKTHVLSNRYIAMKNARIPVEMHLYAQGAHAFGLRRTKLPVSAWPLETWLRTIGTISE